MLQNPGNDAHPQWQWNESICFDVVLRRVLHGTFNKLPTCQMDEPQQHSMEQKWLYDSLYAQSSKQVKLNFKLLRDLCVNTIKERK